MKNIFYFLFTLVILSNSCSKDHDDETLPDLPPMTDPDDVCTSMDDIDFMKYCYENFDINKDGKVSPIEANAVSKIDVPTEVKSLKGIQYFSNITNLYCITTQITTLDVSRYTKLTTLRCRGRRLDVGGSKYGLGQLVELDVSKNPELTSLECSGNLLTSIDISNNSKLEELYCNGNKLTSIDISKNSNLKKLNCTYTELTSLDISKNPSLKELECRFNKLTSLNTSKNQDLQVLDCSNNNLTSLDISQNTNLYRFSYSSCPLLSCITIRKSQKNLLSWLHPDDIQIKYID